MSLTWSKCLNTLRDEISLSEYSVWVQPLKAIEDKSNLNILAPNKQTLNYINKNLKPQIKAAINKHNKKLKVFIGVAPDSNKPNNKPHTAKLFEDYTFDNLVLGNANQMAYGATRQIAEDINASIFNPFIIHGNVTFSSKFARIASSLRFQSCKKPLLQKNSEYLKYYQLT